MPNITTFKLLDFQNNSYAEYTITDHKRDNLEVLKSSPKNGLALDEILYLDAELDECITMANECLRDYPTALKYEKDKVVKKRILSGFHRSAIDVVQKRGLVNYRLKEVYGEKHPFETIKIKQQTVESLVSQIKKEMQMVH